MKALVGEDPYATVDAKGNPGWAGSFPEYRSDASPIATLRVEDRHPPEPSQDDGGHKAAEQKSIREKWDVLNQEIR